MLPTGAVAGGVVSKAFSKVGKWAKRVQVSGKVKDNKQSIEKSGGAGRSSGVKGVVEKDKIAGIMQRSQKAGTGKISEQKGITQRSNQKKASAKQSSQQTGAAKESKYLDDAANISSFSDKIINLNKATFGGSVIQNTSASQIVASASYYSTPLEQGSAIFRGIIQNHLFINGNHRTAVEAFKYFASKNGIKVGLSDSELMSVAKKISAGQLDDVYAIGAALSK